jgi:hypothetical protein
MEKKSLGDKTAAESDSVTDATVDRSCHTADPGPETGDSPEISACARAETPGRAIRGITA